MDEEQFEYLEQVVSQLQQEWFTIRLAEVRYLIAEVRSLRAKLDAVQSCVDVRRYPGDAERVPMNVHPAVVAELHRWLMAQAPSGEGYSEFIAKALAWRRLMAPEVQP